MLSDQVLKAVLKVSSEEHRDDTHYPSTKGLTKKIDKIMHNVKSKVLNGLEISNRLPRVILMHIFINY